MKPVNKSAKLANVCYDIRGPVLARARQLEEEGHQIVKLNIGNLAPFGFDAPDEVRHDVIVNLPEASGYSDSKGLFAARKAIMHYAQTKNIAGVELDDIFLGNGVSELIVMAMNGLLDNGDEVLVPSPDYPLWTAAVSLSGGRPVHYRCDEGAGWLPDLDDIEAARSRSNTRAIVIINPNNPTGALYPRRPAARDPRDRTRAPADRLRRRDLRQDALRRMPAHVDRVAGRRRALHHHERPVEELPRLRLPRRLDGGLRREAARSPTTSKA